MVTVRGNMVRRYASALSLLALVGCADVDGVAGEGADTLAQVEAPARADLGKGDGRDVITIGDSWMSNTLFTGNAIEGALDRLQPFPKYRHYAQQGVLLLKDSGFGPAIPKQWDTAVRQNPNIKTVIMTAGGNDVLQDPGAQADCQRGGAKCKATLKTIGEALGALWHKMGEAGVQDVVYIGYSENAGKAGPDAANATKNGVSEVCAAASNIRCHLIESTPLIAKKDISIDGIHPVQQANDRLAKEILNLMKAEGIRR
jgi:hypothetical protein